MKTKENNLGYWIRRFLIEYLIMDKNYSANTQKSYRDTLRIMLPYISEKLHKKADEILVEDVTVNLVLSFLSSIENERKCSVSTRNQRFSAVSSLAKYISSYCPEYLAWGHSIRNIPNKRAPKTLITYLEKEEINALLNAPNKKTELGRRDSALLLFLYNSGARVEETASLRVNDLTFPGRNSSGYGIVQMTGKGGKTRRCPLWSNTCEQLKELANGKNGNEYLFTNRLGEPISRFGIYEIVKKYANQIADKYPSILNKRLTPHTIRHTTATHLLQAGVDINTIRAWLGHVSINTTNIYAEVNMTMKAKALEQCTIPGLTANKKRWKDDKDILSFLDKL